jgi:trehalose-6-phosphatase
VATPAAASFLDQILAFLNSATGATTIGGTIALILARIFTWKPRWKAIYDDYHGVLIAAVKEAEKAIPDTTENKALRRLDAAMRIAITTDSRLSGYTEADLKQALTVMHAGAEAGNYL